jgi:polyisoprenoid-binding protein YceI
MKKIFFAIFALVLYVSLAGAQTTWKSDPAHSKVSFSVRHMVISEVTGSFTDFDATLIQTKDDFSDSKLTATIKSNSINTDNDGRDKHLRSADFFNVEKYPEITFVSKSFTKKGKDKYKVAGDLTMLGLTKPVALDVKFNGQVNDMTGNTKAGFKATTKVNRKDFGIVWNKTLEAGGLLVGEDVDVTINVEMAKEAKGK